MAVAQVLGGRYEVMDLIGNGGMAVVCRARDNVLGRTVAVKLLAGRHTGDPESRRRIREEARAAAALSHPNIAQVYDYGESDDDGTCVPYVVMELIRGGTLQDRLDAGPVSPRFAMRVGAEVSAALAAAHADGLVHRDIKPANVMVTPAGVKVVDFGIAAAIGTSGSTGPDAEVLGTPAYVAPERLLDDVTEPASDIYALGVLLYQMLSGHSPWSADSTTQMLAAHIYIDPTPLPQLPEVPPYVTALCNRCLAKDPTQRPSAREAAALLAQAAGMRVVEDLPPLVTTGPSVDREPSVLLPRARTEAPAAVIRPAAEQADPSGTGTGGVPVGLEADGAIRHATPAVGPDAPIRPGAQSRDSADAAMAAGAPIPRGAQSKDSADAAMAAGAPIPPRAQSKDSPEAPMAAAAPIPPGAQSKHSADSDPPRRRLATLLAAMATVLAAAALVLWFLLPGGPDGPTTAAVPPAASGPAGAGPQALTPGDVGDPSAGPSAPGPGLVPGPDTGGATGTQRGGAAGDGTPTANPGVVDPGAADPGDPDPGNPDQEPVDPPGGNPGPTTPPEDEQEEPAAQERTLSSTGGSVRATCPSPGTAELLSWSATKPYKVQEVDEGPAQAATAVFRHGNRYVRMTVTCSGGVPSADVSE